MSIIGIPAVASKAIRSALRNASTSTASARVVVVNNVQAKYLSEPCIEVTELDEPVGKISKEECHRVETARLHRAFSVFIFNSEQKLLLQKRAAIKITFPDRWTNSCCSHPLYNDSEMDMTGDAIGVKRAAQRKLAHELGIEMVSLDEMHVMGRFLYKAMSDEDWGEHELDYAIVIPRFNARIQPNPTEVSDLKFVGKEELQAMVERKMPFSPWFSLFMKHKWLHQWWDNLETLASMKDLEAIRRLN